MRKLFLSLTTLFSAGLVQAQNTTADFEALPLAGTDTFYISKANPGTDMGFDNGGLHFPYAYDTSFGGYWDGGFSYSNVTDSTTSGYTNQYAAKAGKGALNSEKYVVFNPGYANNKFVRLTTGQKFEPLSVYLTNSTFAYNSMRDGDQFAAYAVIDTRAGLAFAILDDAGVDVGVFHHHGVVQRRHVRHAAGLVTVVEISAEEGELFCRWFGTVDGRHEIAICADDAPHRFCRDEALGENPHRHTGATVFAGWSIGNVLGSAKAALCQQIVHFRRSRTDKMRKDLPLQLIRQIRARRWRSQIKLRRRRRLRVHRT